SIPQRLIKLVSLEALFYPPGTLEQPEEFVERKILELQEMLRTRRHRGLNAAAEAGTSQKQNVSTRAQGEKKGAASGALSTGRTVVLLSGHCLDRLGESRLGAGGKVLVHDLLVGHPIDDALRYLQGF